PFPVHRLQKATPFIPGDQQDVKKDPGAGSAGPTVQAVLADLTDQCLEQRSPPLPTPALEQLGRGAAATGAPLTQRRCTDPSQWCGHRAPTS
ncbi:MAG: hypothetical protein ACK56F_00475, partial [bacterium]